jgi:hypothetical protein
MKNIAKLVFAVAVLAAPCVSTSKMTALLAYTFADAMLEERKAKP